MRFKINNQQKKRKTFEKQKGENTNFKYTYMLKKSQKYQNMFSIKTIKSKQGNIRRLQQKQENNKEKNKFEPIHINICYENIK